MYKAFPPAEARRLLDRLEIHYTPKHGSWLDMAEIELSVFTKQCLISLVQAAKVAALSPEAFMEVLEETDISVVDYPPEELTGELDTAR